MNPIQATLKAISKFNSLIIIERILIKSYRISFVMGY